jgi:hypothetical protein
MRYVICQVGIKFLYIYINYSRSRDSVVGIAIATGWTTEGSEFESRSGKEYSQNRPDRL